jgi:hypothetical protein
MMMAAVLAAFSILYWDFLRGERFALIWAFVVLATFLVAALASAKWEPAVSRAVVNVFGYKRLMYASQRISIPRACLICYHSRGDEASDIFWAFRKADRQIQMWISANDERMDRLMDFRLYVVAGVALALAVLLLGLGAYVKSILILFVAGAFAAIAFFVAIFAFFRPAIFGVLNVFLLFLKWTLGIMHSLLKSGRLLDGVIGSIKTTHRPMLADGYPSSRLDAYPISRELSFSQLFRLRLVHSVYNDPKTVAHVMKWIVSKTIAP